MIFAATVGSADCLRAGGSESGLVGRDCGFATPHICTDCGLNIDVVCEPTTHCLRAATPNGPAHRTVQSPQPFVNSGDPVQTESCES
jgi:hypothetical protein